MPRPKPFRPTPFRPHPAETAPPCAGGVLTIDLAAIVANYCLLRAKAAPAECAAAVKADAYGLGADRVVPALARAGCRTFFVATVEEGRAVRTLLDEAARPTAAASGITEPAATIYVLNGPPRGAEDAVSEAHLTPVLNSLYDVETWAQYARARSTPLPAALHVDSGISRLGLPPDEAERLIADPGLGEGLRWSLIMSHLACADQPRHPLNHRQLQSFKAARRQLPAAAAASLANSSGILLGADYHFDVVRPGAALYGINPAPDGSNPMRQVVRLQGRILQVRKIDSGVTVGYGATHSAERPAIIATVAAGYADGYLRSLSNSGCAYIGRFPAPLVGRVSMDLTTFDVTGVPPDLVRPGAWVDLIGPHNPVDGVAAAAGTIGYEIFTALGSRYHRFYTADGPNAEQTD